MAYFNVNPTSTTGVSILAAATGKQARFIALGFSNDHASAQVTLRIFDGTASGGTLRFEMSLLAGSGGYLFDDRAGKSVFPMAWFTAGNAVECSISASGSVQVWGEVVGV